MKTFQEFILECYNISEGSEIAGRLADLAQKNANKLFYHDINEEIKQKKKLKNNNVSF